MPKSIDEAREILRWAVGRSSLRAVAREAAMNHKSLGNFVSGTSRKPGPDVLPTILELAGKHESAWRKHAQTYPATTLTGGPSGAPAAAGSWRGDTADPLPGASELSGPTVAVPVMLLAYWRGRVEEQVRTVAGVGHTISGIGDSLRALQGMLEEATHGMTEFIEGGVFPPVSALAGRMEDARPGELEAAEALVAPFRGRQAEVVDRTTKPPAGGKRRTGGSKRPA